MGIKVLHVDDDERTLRIVARFLEGRGFTVISTTNPFIAPIIHQENPALIVMDIEMPLLSGDRIISILRGHEFSNIPVVFFSAKSAEFLAALTEKVERSAWVAKESGLAMLLQKINSLVTV